MMMDLQFSSFQVPYLLVSDGVGERVERACQSSQLNGDVCVEDVKLADTWYRRLVFKRMVNVIQSEVMLVLPKVSGLWKKSTVNPF